MLSAQEAFRRLAIGDPAVLAAMIAVAMNDIKKKYPFVDLLKPEKEAVVPILLALNPDALPKLRAIGAVATRLGWDSIRGRLGFLGEPLALELHPEFVGLGLGALELPPGLEGRVYIKSLL